MKRLLLCLFAGAFFAMGACTKPQPVTQNNNNNNTVTYDDTWTINGGPFKNTAVNVTAVNNSSGAYSTGGKNTSIVIDGTFDTSFVHMNFIFPGGKKGTYTVDQAATTMTLALESKATGNQDDYNGNGGAFLYVTRYDAVGGKIAGTFNGNFTSVGVNYAVTNGAFSVVRANDTP